MEKFYALNEGTSGDFRKFSFSDTDYVIKEVIHQPEFSMSCNWDTGVCPHCKHRIEKTVVHEFYRIEILEKENAKNVKKEDLVLIGDTLDKRKIMVPIEYYDTILSKSKTYKNLIEVK